MGKPMGFSPRNYNSIAHLHTTAKPFPMENTAVGNGVRIDNRKD
jgi:hypothetical protein